MTSQPSVRTRTLGRDGLVVSELTSDSPRWRILPASTSSAIAPTVSSMGVFGSTRCW